MTGTVARWRTLIVDDEPLAREGIRTRLESLGGFDVVAECGGACACATCHVYVAPEWLGRLVPTKQEEDDQLDMALAVEPNSRLSCQILMRPDLDGLRLTLAPGSETEEKHSSRVA